MNDFVAFLFQSGVFTLLGAAWGVSYGVSRQKRTQQEAEKAALQAQQAAAAIAQPQVWTAPFKPLVSVGVRFPYLGLEMLCVAHSMQGAHGPVPCLRCEYVAADGRIATWLFSTEEQEAVKHEIAREMIRRGELLQTGAASGQV